MKKTEKARYAQTLRQIPAKGGFDRVYFGAEFCQWRMPAVVSVLKAYERAASQGMGFTLLTPWVTDAGLGKLDIMFGRLVEAADGIGGPSPEVVVNDYGVLLSLKQGFPGLVPVLGRLLTRQKRCPRVPGILEGLPAAGRELYMRAGIEDPVSAKFLKKLGIKRVELDNPLQGMEVKLKSVLLKGTLYTPYAYVTVTRHCPASFDGNTWQCFTGCRIKGCLENVMEMKNSAHPEPLIMRGNAQFVMNMDMPEDLSGMGIDRVVYMEDVP